MNKTLLFIAAVQMCHAMGFPQYLVMRIDMNLIHGMNDIPKHLIIAEVVNLN